MKLSATMGGGALKGPIARLRSGGRGGEIIFVSLATLAALALVTLIGLIVYQLTSSALPALQKFGVGFLGGTTWDPVAEKFGALPAIYGTLVTSLLAMIIAVPISIGAAIFLAELAPHAIRDAASFLVELLAAVPSVVYGLWGLFVLVPLVKDPLEMFLGRYLGFLPLFQGTKFGFGILAGGIILAIMILPIVTATARDIIRMVPESQKEAMLALGATRWETLWKVVLPYAGSGITGAVILGLGRALGETMAVTMVVGNSNKISPSLFAPGHTMASQIASEFSEATSRLYISSLIELGLVLLGITLLVNVLARLLVWKSTGGRLASRGRT
ncbi:MAG: phosphate ABC transporter permease subunit PstC [Dehalococcoidia bacterium]|nr:phosphate ABC transporter permease subunit PstC [Dehalococcoidia bacterium]